MYRQQMKAAQEQQEKYTAGSAEWEKRLAFIGDDPGSGNSSSSSNSGMAGE